MTKHRLSIESYQKLLRAERSLTDVVEEFPKAEKCGIDCQQQRAALKAQLETIAQIKANYAP